MANPAATKITVYGGEGNQPEPGKFFSVLITIGGGTFQDLVGFPCVIYTVRVTNESLTTDASLLLYDTKDDPVVGTTAEDYRLVIPHIFNPLAERGFYHYTLNRDEGVLFEEGLGMAFENLQFLLDIGLYGCLKG